MDGLNFYIHVEVQKDLNEHTVARRGEYYKIEYDN